MNVMNRGETLEFLSHHVKTDMLMKHLFSVETDDRGYLSDWWRRGRIGCSLFDNDRGSPLTWRG